MKKIKILLLVIIFMLGMFFVNSQSFSVKNNTNKIVQINFLDTTILSPLVFLDYLLSILGNIVIDDDPQPCPERATSNSSETC